MKKLLFTLALFLCFSSKAQQNYLFTHLGTKEGLGSNAVQAIHQDKNGFIWIATSSNLQRYDGHRLKTFSAGIDFPEGVIHAMIIDRKNRIWMQVGERTIGWLNADDFSWHPVKLNLPANYVTKQSFLYLTKDDQLILMYQKYGIVSYDEKTNSLDAEYNPFVLPPGWEIIVMWQDDLKNYWIGTQNGLVKYNPKSRKMSYGGHNEEGDSTIEKLKGLKVVNMFYIDKQNRAWISSWPKETGLRVKSLEPDGSLKDWDPTILRALKNAYHTVFAIIETDAGEWMYGTNLLAKLDAEHGKIYPLYSDMPGEYSIRFDIINQIFTDREKNLWLSTNKGVYYFNPGSHVFRSIYNRLPSKDSSYTSDVTSLLQTSSGELLVSTWGNGIFSYDTDMNPVDSKIFPRNSGLNEGMVWSMAEDRKGNIWWGKQDGWLGNYDAGTKMISKWQVPLTEKRTIRQITCDENGNIWMGTQGGHIIRYDVANGTYKLIFKSKGVIGKLYCSRKNEIWAGTDYDGLYRIDGRTGRMIAHYHDSLQEGKKLISDGVGDIMEYDQNTMLIVSNGLNILDLNTGTFSYLFRGVELFNIEKDKDNRVWLSGSGKIICFSMNRKEMNYSFDERDGLDNFSFSLGAATRLSNGRIIFGTSHNMVIFDPVRAMGGSRKFHDLQVSGLMVNEKDIPVDSVLKAGSLELGPGNISIRAMFTTNSFQNSFDLYYMLEDMDKSWKLAPSTGELNLNYLPPGHYVLKAAIFGESNRVVRARSIPILIRPPFYQTWWFYVIMVIAGLTILFLLDRQRMIRKEKMHKMRTDIAEKLHREVNSALGNINILSEMALLKADEEPEKAKEFVEQIQDKSGATLTAMEDMLWAITPGNDSMGKAAARMQEFLQGINNRGDAHIEMVVDEQLRNIHFDMQWRYEAFQLFKESVNGLMQAGVKNCKVHIGHDKGELSFMLQFQNEGCDMKQLNNYFQSRKLAGRVEALNARLQVAVHKSSSEIECFIPSVLN